ncbi:MAG: sigma-54-dependent Fis family transcriptional regulator [Acidobacteria bacterium]|nr:sigma-54-dependent Fis family transcriptional regulator [Acidobacteriota bacterium]
MTQVSGSVLIVDDEKEICAALAELVRREGLTAIQAHDGETALAQIRNGWPDVLLVDRRLPGLDGLEVMRKARERDQDLPVILITAYAEIRGAVEAIKAGAHDYVSKPFNHAEVIRVVLRALGERELKRKLKSLSSQLQHSGSLREIMGPSDQIGCLISELNQVAASNFSVVILGETGSGKEAVARAIHQASGRSNGAFVPVDCGAIPETLLEDELFGHERGAFTSANARHAGKFEAARGGTLFLDEISNMPLGSQAKLLRALQEKTIFRIGGTQPISVDVRVLAASNQDLQGLAELNAFRRDLYFRLNEFAIPVPPLRHRREDILYLAKRFLDVTNVELHKQVKGFSESAVATLLGYPWPGNVRQLRSTIRRATLLADELIVEKHLDITPTLGPALEPARVPCFPPARASAGDLPLKEIVRRSVVRVEREAIARVLRRTGGNKAKAARLLQIDYKTIHCKVRTYGIAVRGEEEYG